MVNIDFLNESALTQVTLTLGGHLGKNVAHTSTLELDVAAKQITQAKQTSSNRL